MFAIVEFENEKKECSVIPLIWLSRDKASCRWPNNITSQRQLEAMIEDLREPDASWGNYAVKQVHAVTEKYAAANTFLQVVLAESINGSPDNDNAEPEPNVKEEEQYEEKMVAEQHQLQESEIDIFDVDDDDNEGVYADTARKKRKRKARNLPGKIIYSSESDDRSASPLKRKGSNKRPATVNYYSSDSETKVAKADKSRNSNSSSKSLKHHAASPAGSSKLSTTAAQSASRPDPAAVGQNTQPLDQWQQSIMQDLERIKSVQDQQTILLTQIWEALQLKNIQALQCPPDVPDLPMDRLRDFGRFEKWLAHEQNFVYMRSRMASIGGSTVRLAVMNMMKFVMSNRLGMTFNWVGSTPRSAEQRQKYAFRATLACKLVNEAAKIYFQDKQESVSIIGELTDKAIGQACQDWLKQSKHRYQNNSQSA